MSPVLSPRMLCLLVAIAATMMLAVAFFLEHRQGMVPCPLCMMQRIWVGLAGLIALAAAVHGRGLRYWSLGIGASALIGSGFSIRQLWLQSLPEDQVPACGPDLYYMFEVFPLMEVLQTMVVGTGDCAEVHRVLGLSIPAWVLLAFAAMLVAAVLVWRGAAASAPPASEDAGGA